MPTKENSTSLTPSAATQGKDPLELHELNYAMLRKRLTKRGKPCGLLN